MEACRPPRSWSCLGIRVTLVPHQTINDSFGAGYSAKGITSERNVWPFVPWLPQLQRALSEVHEGTG